MSKSLHLTKLHGRESMNKRLGIYENLSITRAQKYALLLITTLISFAILYLDCAYAQSDMQSGNSTNLEERQKYSYDIVDGIYALFVVIVFIIIGIKARNPQGKIRAWVALFVVFGSIFLYLFPEVIEFQSNDNNGQRGLAIFLVIIALAIQLAYRTKKSIPWKKYKVIRRHFSGEVRQQVLDAQKYKCANCNLSISQPLVHYDHIDGNHSNNDISNCQALCPNCHSLKTDDDRRNQR